jgi:hypothetical protein
MAAQTLKSALKVLSFFTIGVTEFTLNPIVKKDNTLSADFNVCAAIRDHTRRSPKSTSGPHKITGTPYAVIGRLGGGTIKHPNPTVFVDGSDPNPDPVYTNEIFQCRIELRDGLGNIDHIDSSTVVTIATVWPTSLEIPYENQGAIMGGTLNKIAYQGIAHFNDLTQGPNTNCGRIDSAQACNEEVGCEYSSQLAKCTSKKRKFVVMFTPSVQHKLPFLRSTLC